MTTGDRRARLVAAEAAFVHQRLDGLDMRHRPPAATSRRLLYALQSGGEVRVPARLVRAALRVPVLELAAGYLLTVDDELIAFDSQGCRRADLPTHPPIDLPTGRQADAA